MPVTIREDSVVEKSLTYVTDAKGRKLGLRQLPFLEEFRIIEAVGNEVAQNATYMNMLNPLLFLAEIDGDPIEIPRNKRQVEALIQRAGRDGFSAVLKGITEHFNPSQDFVEQQIKNGEGTPA